MESRLSDDWRELSSLLISHRVKYLLVGAHALAVHGQPRVTLDLDVFVEASTANARKIRAVLDELGFGSVESARPSKREPRSRAPKKQRSRTKRERQRNIKLRRRTINGLWSLR